MLRGRREFWFEMSSAAPAKAASGLLAYAKRHPVARCLPPPLAAARPTEPACRLRELRTGSIAHPPARDAASGLADGRHASWADAGRSAASARRARGS